MSSRSHPSVHPLDIEVPQLTEGAAAEIGGPPDDRVRMKDVQGMPGTPAGLALRLIQLGFTVVSVAVMAGTSDFPSVTAFRHLVGALSLQCLWSLSLAIVDVYALLVKRCIRNPRVVGLFAMGDGITSTLTFGAACASAGITVLIDSDFNSCSENHCTRFETSTAMAFCYLVRRDRTKHVELDRHFITEKVTSEVVKLEHVNSKQQIADILTKALPRPTFENLISKLGLHDIYSPA